jgi:hypothetical protein
MMTRMQISFDDAERQWLEQKAREAGVSIAEIVRCAIRQARQAELLESTKGLWRQGDGLAYQRRVRREWR